MATCAPPPLGIAENINVVSRRCVACVSYYTPGWGESTRVVDGVSVCDAACRALEAFHSEDWHGPRPGPDTWLEVTVLVPLPAALGEGFQGP